MTSRSLARWSWVAGRLTIAAGLVVALAGRVGAQAVHAGAHAGVMLDAATPFSESICPDESTLLVGVHAGYDVSSLLGVEGALSLHAEHPDLCLNGLLPPPPENGTRTFRRLDEDARGYPFVTPEGRAVLRSPELADVAAARLALGGAWMPDKGIGALIAGVGVQAAWGSIPAKLDIERWWFDVPFTDVEQTFADGELVSEEEIPGEFSENPVQLRASVGWVVF